MRITVNEEAREFADGMTIEALLAVLGFSGRRLAVEVNEDVVPRSRHAQHVLKDGDHVEIVHAIGGG